MPMLSRLKSIPVERLTWYFDVFCFQFSGCRVFLKHRRGVDPLHLRGNGSAKQGEADRCQLVPRSIAGRCSKGLLTPPKLLHAASECVVYNYNSLQYI